MLCYYGRRKFTSYQPFELYRKFSADHIFNGHEFLQRHVLVTTAEGIIADLLPEAEAGPDVERLEGIISPGFINCHCHLELSHMKGHIPQRTGLVDFVLRVVNERHYGEEEIIAAIENAEDEMLRNGMVAVGDICNNMLTLSQKKKGRLYYHNFIEASGFPPAVAEGRFKRAQDFYEVYAAAMPANSIVPHAPYSVSPEMFEMINSFPGNALLSIHNQEIAAENDFFETGTGELVRLYQTMGIDISFFKPTGKSSVQTYLPYLDKAKTLLLVHNVSTTENDLAFLQLHSSGNQLQTFFCLCPKANRYISGLLPDVPLLSKYGCRMVLGTDSLASNDQLNMLDEMRVLQQGFPSLDLSTLLGWATSNGAKALQLSGKFGSFEKGKQPGIVQIENVPGMKLVTGSSARRIL